MAFSAQEGKIFFKEWLDYFSIEDPHRIKTILDIGAGAGVYADLARQVKDDFEIDAIEVYEPYIERFSLRNKYDQVFIGDAVSMNIKEYDLIILGDVLEHINGATAYQFMQNLKMKARFIWLSMPVKPFRKWHWGYNQPDEDFAENIKERHVADWKYEDLLNTFGPFLWQVPFRTVVVLIAEGLR